MTEPASYKEVAPADPEESREEDSDSADESPKKGRSKSVLTANKLLGVAVALLVLVLGGFVCFVAFKGSAPKTSQSASRDTSNLATASFMVWTSTPTDQTCAAHIVEFCKENGSPFDFVNAFEDDSATDAKVCVGVAGFYDREIGIGLCAKAKTAGAKRCGTFAAPVAPLGSGLRVRFPSLDYMQSMDKREGHTLTVAFEDAKTVEAAKEQLKSAADSLHERRELEGNVFADVLEGSGDTDQSQLVWLEEWKYRGDHGKIPDTYDDYVSGPLLELKGSEGGSGESRGAPWDHVGGFR